MRSRAIERVIVAAQPPRWDTAVFSPTIEEIKLARSAQLRGQFDLPAKLANTFRTNDAMFVAEKNRLSALGALGVAIEYPDDISATIKAECELSFGPDGNGIDDCSIIDIARDMINHGVGVAHITQRFRRDGSRVDFFLEHWPIRHCYWDPTTQQLMTRTDSRGDVPIKHGNGEWIVFSKSQSEPWTKDAAILPGALVMAAHAFAANDWAKGSRSHGNAKVIGEMPEGYAIEDENGLTQEAQMFLALLGSIANDDAPSGIKPTGSSLEYLVNGSSAWQVWESLMTNREKAAARIYLGTDGVLGANGGAPGVDITALFGVATTFVQGDCKAIARGIKTGFIDPWCRLNFGRTWSKLQRKHLIPDQDEEAIRTNYADRSAKFQAAIKAAKENGFVIDQSFVNSEADKYGVQPPTLAVSAPSGADFYAYELDGGVVLIDEVRARKGLAPLPNGQGAMTVPQARALADGTVPAPPPQTNASSDVVEPSAAAVLADKMTSAQVERCVHNGVNVCRICGIKKTYDFDTDGDGLPNKDAAGNTNWKFTWVPI